MKADDRRPRRRRAGANLEATVKESVSPFRARLAAATLSGSPGTPSRVRGARAWPEDGGMEMLLKTVGENIRTARRELGLRQVDLAAITGLPQDHVSRIENGRRNVTLATLVLISLAVKREVGELMSSDMRARQSLG